MEEPHEPLSKLFMGFYIIELIKGDTGILDYPSFQGCLDPGFHPAGIPTVAWSYHLLSSHPPSGTLNPKPQTLNRKPLEVALKMPQRRGGAQATKTAKLGHERRWASHAAGLPSHTSFSVWGCRVRQKCEGGGGGA